MLRENIIDKQRTVSSMLRSDFISQELQPKLSMIIKDINSLVEHIKFSFDRLDYLQDTVFGLCKYRSKQNHQNFHYRIGYFYASNAHRKHLRNEFSLYA